MKNKLIFTAYIILFSVEAFSLPFFIDWYNAKLGVDFIPFAPFLLCVFMFIGQVIVAILLGVKAFEEDFKLI